MDLRQAFIHWYFNEFQLCYLYTSMCKTTEGSPHHRERTVGAHTDMVVSSYISIAGPYWDHAKLLGAFAAAFHDVGKPACEETVHSEERGEYRRYHGHEVRSARLWEDWAVRNWKSLRLGFPLGPRDIYAVGWLIEYHLPWQLKNPEKLRRLALTTNELFGDASPFVNLLMADGIGRICDDDKVGKSQAWCDDFTHLSETTGVQAHKEQVPTLYVPIAASGSGKSSYIETYIATNDVEVYSWDALRLEWYVTDVERTNDIKVQYKLAFERSCEDKKFNQLANTRFMDLLKTGNHVVVDNTNLTKKRRQFFVQEARKKGYKVIALLFPIEFGQLTSRVEKREDKFVPQAAVERQYLSLQLPQFGEFDVVWVLPYNIKCSSPKI